MLYPLSILSLVLLALIHLTQGHSHSPIDARAIYTISNDTVPFSTRAYWMRRANQALSDLVSPCPFAAFGTVIVNHTDTCDDARGKVVCIGANRNGITGNPTLHGEIAAISNCTDILTDPNGEYNLTASEALDAFADLSLYTNAESCPMCASAIRWAGFKEYIFGTTIETLIDQGWGQIDISSLDVFDKSVGLGTETDYLAAVLTNETDVYFAWQFQDQMPCPAGCARPSNGSSCAAL